MKYISDYHIKKFHIPQLTHLEGDCLHFSYGGKEKRNIAITGTELQGLLQMNIKDDEMLSSTEFFHKYTPGSWLHSNGVPSRLYYSPFHPNLVRKGDLIVLKDEKGEVEIMQYLGGKYYLVKSRGKMPLIIKISISNSFNYEKAIIRNPTKVYEKGFEELYLNLLQQQELQIHTKPGTISYPFYGTQRLHDTYVDELQNIYIDFGFHATEIIHELNKRRIIKCEGGYSLHQNRNSRSFYRDANYSFSIVKEGDDIDDNNAEVVIISFYPTKQKKIEIVQIGGNPYFSQDDYMSLRTEIITYMKGYFTKLGFERLDILRGDKNINYIHPKQNTLKEKFNLQHHQKTMLLRYNVTPHRKWGFSKPDERYSSYQL